MKKKASSYVKEHQLTCTFFYAFRLCVGLHEIQLPINVTSIHQMSIKTLFTASR